MLFLSNVFFFILGILLPGVIGFGLCLVFRKQIFALAEEEVNGFELDKEVNMDAVLDTFEREL